MLLIVMAREGLLGLGHQWMVRLKFPIGTDTFITGMFSAFDVCNDFSVLTSICSQPGDIQWLSKVDKVDVQPSSNDVFGQVRSGNLTLTGRLGVFRINKGGFQKPGDMGNIIGTERLVRTSWDTLDAEKQYGESGKTRLWRYSRYGNAKGPRMKQHQLDVFSLPVRIMDADATEVDYEMPLLTGLLLLPTGKKQGQFRRVGQFEITEQWWGGNVITPFTNETNIVDERFFVFKHKNGDYTISIV
jgi:hypothetical protein